MIIAILVVLPLTTMTVPAITAHAEITLVTVVIDTGIVTEQLPLDTGAMMADMVVQVMVDTDMEMAVADADVVQGMAMRVTVDAGVDAGVVVGDTRVS